MDNLFWERQAKKNSNAMLRLQADLREESSRSAYMVTSGAVRGGLDCQEGFDQAFQEKKEQDLAYRYSDEYDRDVALYEQNT